MLLSLTLTRACSLQDRCLHECWVTGPQCALYFFAFGSAGAWADGRHSWACRQCKGHFDSTAAGQTFIFSPSSRERLAVRSIVSDPHSRLDQHILATAVWAPFFLHSFLLRCVCVCVLEGVLACCANLLYLTTLYWGMLGRFSRFFACWQKAEERGSGAGKGYNLNLPLQEGGRHGGPNWSGNDPISNW